MSNYTMDIETSNGGTCNGVDSRFFNKEQVESFLIDNKLKTSCYGKPYAKSNDDGDIISIVPPRLIGVDNYGTTIVQVNTLDKEVMMKTLFGKNTLMPTEALRYGESPYGDYIEVDLRLAGLTLDEWKKLPDYTVIGLEFMNNKKEFQPVLKGDHRIVIRSSTTEIDSEFFTTKDISRISEYMISRWAKEDSNSTVELQYYIPPIRKQVTDDTDIVLAPTLVFLVNDDTRVWYDHTYTDKVAQAVFGKSLLPESTFVCLDTDDDMEKMYYINLKNAGISLAKWDRIDRDSSVGLIWNPQYLCYDVQYRRYWD